MATATARKTPAFIGLTDPVADARSHGECLAPTRQAQPSRSTATRMTGERDRLPHAEVDVVGDQRRLDDPEGQPDADRDPDVHEPTDGTAAMAGITAVRKDGVRPITDEQDPGECGEGAAEAPGDDAGHMRRDTDGGAATGSHSAVATMPSRERRKVNDSGREDEGDRDQGDRCRRSGTRTRSRRGRRRTAAAADVGSCPRRQPWRSWRSSIRPRVEATFAMSEALRSCRTTTT